MSDVLPRGRPIYAAPAGCDEKPVCLMHSHDPSKPQGKFDREIKAIMAGSSNDHRPQDRFDFSGFAFLVADFRKATFAKNPDFSGAIFIRHADFGMAAFTEEADFISATFTKGANFRKAIFAKNVDFGFTTFTKRVIFDQARFTGTSNSKRRLSSKRRSSTMRLSAGWQVSTRLLLLRGQLLRVDFHQGGQLL